MWIQRTEFKRLHGKFDHFISWTWITILFCSILGFEDINVMLRANGRNVVCQQLPTLLDVTCCVGLYTLLHVVACCWKVLRKAWNRSNFKLRANGRSIVGSCWQTMLCPFARGLTQQNSMGGGGGEFSSSHRGHVSMWSLDMYTTLPPEVRSRNTYDEIRRAFGLIKLPRRKLEKKSENRRKKKPLAPRVDMYMVYIDFSQRNSVICTLGFFVHGPKQGFKTAEFVWRGEREGGRGWGEGGITKLSELVVK